MHTSYRSRHFQTHQSTLESHTQDIGEVYSSHKLGPRDHYGTVWVLSVSITSMSTRIVGNSTSTYTFLFVLDVGDVVLQAQVP